MLATFLLLLLINTSITYISCFILLVIIIIISNSFILFLFSVPSPLDDEKVFTHSFQYTCNNIKLNINYRGKY